MRIGEIFYIIIGIIIGLGLAYFFLWGQPYSNLKQDYNQCQDDYQELNQSYIQLQEETKELLKEYESCEDKVKFINVLTKLSNIAKLVRFVGLI